jgi:5'(3')-deoxyribonucleotidase
MGERLTDSPEHLRLGIDLDGVVADFNAGWIERYNREYGAELHPDHVVGWDELHHLTGFDTMERFWAWARGDGRSVFRDLPPMPGALDALRELAQRHRIVIITARFDWAIGDTLAWLAEHGVLAREVHFQAAKHEVACDIYLDDSPYQIEALARERPDRTVCRQVTAWNRPLPGVVDVHSWPEFQDVVRGVEARHAMQRV